MNCEHKNRVELELQYEYLLTINERKMRPVSIIQWCCDCGCLILFHDDVSDVVSPRIHDK